MKRPADHFAFEAPTPPRTGDQPESRKVVQTISTTNSLIPDSSISANHGWKMEYVKHAQEASKGDDLLYPLITFETSESGEVLHHLTSLLLPLKLDFSIRFQLPYASCKSVKQRFGRTSQKAALSSLPATPWGTTTVTSSVSRLNLVLKNPNMLYMFLLCLKLLVPVPMPEPFVQLLKLFSQSSRRPTLLASCNLSVGQS